MKTIFLTLFLFFTVIHVNAQNYNWITPNKTYLKLYIAEDGIYNVSYEDFVNAGITPNFINPATIKLYNKGTELPVYFQGDIDGKFTSGDFFEFYGTRNYGGVTKTYDQNNVVLWTTDEYYDNFSDTNVYWVGWDGSNGLRYSSYNYSVITPYSNQYYFHKLRLEKDTFYSQGENISANDFRFLTSEKFRGEGWFWTTLNSTQSFSDTFSLPQLYTIPQTSTLKLFAYPTNRNTLVLNEHKLEVRINGNLISTLFSNDMNRIDTSISFSSSLLSNVSVNNISVTYTFKDSLVSVSSSLKLDFFEISYPRIFKLNSNRMSTSALGIDTVSKLFSVSGFNNLNPLTILDVANNYRITNNTFIADTLKFTGKGNGNFQISNSSSLKKPFRIKQKSVPNLTSVSNGADYLLIYHKLFNSQAEQLRAYRESHDGFRSFKAEIEDIYDIFNYGIENPVAVRNFTKYVYDNWQLPKMSYICLMGRASLDPKKNQTSSSYYINYLPTYGYPPTDGYFANFYIGTFYYYPVVAIGRLPAYYPEEAQSMVDKIIAYENQQPDKWIKNYTYITGGGTTSEQNSHQSKSNSEINTYVLPYPLSGEAHKIYRSDISGNTTFDMKDSLINDINRGTAYLNFRGHAGSHDWEVTLDDPDLLSNGSKLPIILSLTCFTGENSLAYYRGFGERFVYLQNKGAIGFIGTTGWSYAQQGNDYGTHIINTVKFDTARRIGSFTKYAGKRMSVDSNSFNVRHTVNCYSLIGDPAVTLKIPKFPEFSLSSEDYKLSNDFPEVNEDVSFTLYPKNFGLFADSCKIRFELKKNNQNFITIDTIRRNFAHKDSLIFKFNIDTTGVYSITATLDAGNYYPNEIKSNNVLNISLPVKNNSFVALHPVDNSVVSGDSVEFVNLNPLVNSASNSVSIILQFDTTSTFGSAVNRTFMTKITGGVTTKIKTNIPNPVANKVYYWRTNTLINGDSAGWSGVKRFVYVSMSKSSAENDKGTRTGKSVEILKVSSGQYSQTDYDNTIFSSNGIQLYNYPAELFIRSFGSNAEEASFFSVGNKNVYIDGGQNGGINILKVKKLTGAILMFKNLKMNAASYNDSLVNVLNTFDSTHYLMLLNASYVPGGITLNANAKNKLKQFGSVYCDSIGLLSYFHTWSLIGYLGANSSQTSEMFDPCCRPAPGCYSCNHWTESISSKNVTFSKTSGTVSTIAGPAHSWESFSWTQTLTSNSFVKFDVYGIDKSNNQTLLLSDIQTSNFNDLSFVNAYQYPRLKFIAKLSIDTAVGTASSVLNSLKINYIKPAEITYVVNSLDFSSSYKTNQEFKFSCDYFNAGNIEIPGIITNIYKKSVNSANLLLSDTLAKPFPYNMQAKQYFKFTIPYFRDSMKTIVEFKPIGQYNDCYTYNNLLIFSMKNVSLNSPSAGIIIYSDGSILHGGETVRQNPEIKIQIENHDNLLQSGSYQSNNLSIRLNDEVIPLNDKRIASLVSSLSNKENKAENKAENNNGITMMFYPQLQNGQNKISVVYDDNTGYSDSAVVDVVVNTEFSVKDLYNFPNPMKSETTFIFEITGADSPGNNVRLKIYTVSGKLIREIEHPVVIGVNQILWDGKDSDGDLIANGNYFYKIIADNDEKIETQTQKLVILR